ncbi:MAG: carbohydrate-binding family 9-like protein [Prosthecobacter sp.]
MKRYLVRNAARWSEADPLTDFIFPWEDRPAPKTEFRAMHDDAVLRFRFDCVDEDLVLPEGPTAKERALGADRVEIFFATDLSLHRYYGLEMSPRGDVADYAAKFYREIDWSWSCEDLALEPDIREGGYTVIGSIPLKALHDLGVLRGREMFAGLYRAEFHRKPDGNVHCGWMPWVNPHTEKPDFHVPASFGVLELK